MFVDVNFVKYLAPPLLDKYLEAGWFRMGQGMFTTNFLNFENQFYSAIWLRIKLQENNVSKIKESNKFDVRIQKFELTNEKEALYEKYKSCINFETSSSLQKLFYGDVSYNIFNSYEVTIFDKQKLIGLGVFDLGQVSSQGIVSFYDPDYKKYSIGKLIICKKIEYLNQQGLQYFYPGYFAPNYARFDYKLNLDPKNLEFFDVICQQWKKISEFAHEKTPFLIFNQKLQRLKTEMDHQKIQNKLMNYGYFDVGMLETFAGQKLLDIPKFIFCFYNTYAQFGIVSFNIFTFSFELLLCEKAYEVNKMEVLDTSFNQYILKPISVLAEHSDEVEFLKLVRKYLIKLPDVH